MNIFFDHQTFSQQRFGGISRYFCELISGINATDEHKAHLSLLWSNNEHLQEYKLSTLPYPFPKRNRLLQKSNKLFNIIDCKLGHYDIYHSTYFDNFLSKNIGRRPLVTTFYDMTYERLSHRFKELSQDTAITEQKRKIAQASSHLIAISHSTKHDMIDILGISPERISVIHLASSFALDLPGIATASTLTTGEPYLLYVGNRNGYKNFSLFLKASAELLRRYKMMIVCAGGGQFTINELALIRSLNITGFVKQLAITDGILQDLYRRATAFVFPSFYEGFGIPVLEAFSCNCPCVVSDTSSLSEVAGAAALYIDPSNKESITSALEKIITNSTLRTDLIQHGRQRLSLFSWQVTVKQTIDLYEKLAK